MSSATCKALLFMVVLGVFLTTSTSFAQTTTTQRYTFLGWTATGNETVSQVTVGASGLSTEGDPVNWSYSVLEIADPSGISRFKVGQPEGEPQQYWKKAKPEEEGQKRIKTMGLRKAIEGTVSPDGQMTLVSITSSERNSEMVVTGDCPGCSVCSTQITLFLFAKEQQKVYQLSQQSHTGNPFPPDAASEDCPTITARSYWHPENNRLAIIYDKLVTSSGERVQRLDNHKLPEGFQGITALWGFPESKAASEREANNRLLAKKKEGLLTIPQDDRSARASLLAQIGDLHRQNGRLSDARSYYNSALEFDRKNIDASLGQAMLLLHEGDRRAATRAIRKVETADRRSGKYTADIGLYYLTEGDFTKAQKYLQRAADQDETSDVNYTKRLELGHRILSTDLEAGIAYMDNLLAGAPDNPGPDLNKELIRTYVRIANEAIHLGNIQMATRYVPKLDPQSNEARWIALMVSALSPQKAAIALDRASFLISENPGDCGMYIVRALAFKSMTKPVKAFENFAAASICDPGFSEAHYNLANMYIRRGQIERAIVHYKDYQAYAPKRRGDPVNQARHAQIDALLPRLAHEGVVLLSHTCSPKGEAVRCTGILLNTAATSSGKVAIVLTATERRRKREAGQSTATLPTIAPGTSLDFNIVLDNAIEHQLSLTAGRNDTEIKLNTTPIRVN